MENDFDTGLAKRRSELDGRQRGHDGQVPAVALETLSTASGSPLGAAADEVEIFASKPVSGGLNCNEIQKRGRKAGKTPCFGFVAKVPANTNNIIIQ